MPWFVCCDAAQMFLDKEGDVSYVAEVKKHVARWIGASSLRLLQRLRH